MDLETLNYYLRQKVIMDQTIQVDTLSKLILKMLGCFNFQKMK